MNTLLIYILELNLYLTLFVVAYLLFLKNEPYHRVNRWIILSSIALAAMLPLVDFGSSGLAAIQIIQLEPVLISAKTQVLSTPAGMNIPSLISVVYFLGFTISMMVYVWQFICLQNLIRGSKIIKNGVITEFSAEGLNSPASFFKNILWSGNIKPESREWIENHELVHIREKHSIDMLIIRFFEALCWFNPVIYSFRHALEATHEFRADEVVASQHGNVAIYSEIILSQALDVNPSVLAHQFSKSKLLKRRIIMLNKETKYKKSFAKYLALIPTLALAFLINACTEEHTEEPDVSKTDMVLKTIKSDLLPNKVEGTDIYTYVDVMPEYPSGQEAMIAFLRDNINYPESCKIEEIEGTVYVSFVVDSDGVITDIKTLRSPDERLSQNAMDVIAKMPAWTPGKQDGKLVKVMYNLPIKYQLK